MWLLNTLVWLGFFAVWFIIIWGANYKRESIENQLGLTEVTVTSEDVHLLAESLLQVIVENVDATRDTDAALNSLRDSLTNVVNDIHSNAPTLPQEIKSLPKGTLIYLGNAAGVISPWLLEAHVDSALPPTEFVAIAAHELAHVAGYAGEADADLLGALAGLNADDGFTRYAVALRLFRTLAYQLTYQLPENQKERFANSLPEGWQEALPKKALGDWELAVVAYQRHSPPEKYTEVQQQVYNWYLLSQGVSEGIADYSRIVKLLVFAQQKGLVFGEPLEDPTNTIIEVAPAQQP